MAPRPRHHRTQADRADRRRPAGEPPARGRPRLWLFLVLGGLVIAVLVEYAVVKPRRAASHEGEDEALGGAAALEAEAFLSEPAVSPQATAEEMTEEAFRVAAALVDAYPASTDALEFQGRVYYTFGRSGEAVEVWKRCLEIDSGCAGARQHLGEAALAKGDFSEAVAHFRKLAQSDPAPAEAAAMLADALLKSGQVEEAVGMLEREIAGRPQVVCLVQLGEGYLQLKEYAKAKEVLLRAAGMAPPGERTCYALATACGRLGEAQSAQRWMDQFQKLRTERTQRERQRAGAYNDPASVRQTLAAIHADAARVCHARGDARRAEAMARRAAALAPKPTAAPQGSPQGTRR